ENLPLQAREMVAENAAVFLKAKNFPLAAEEALDFAGQVVDVVGIGEYWGLCPEPHVPSTGSLKAFQLLSKESGETIVITGAVYGNTQELKKFLKLYRAREEWDSTLIALERRWIFPLAEGLYGLGEYLTLAKERLQALWETEVASLGARRLTAHCYPLQTLPGEGFWALETLVPQEDRPSHWEGIKSQLLSEQNLLLSRANEENFISHLQFLEKFTKIFPFKGDWVLCRFGKAPKKQKDLWKRLEKQLRLASQELRIPLNPETAVDESSDEFLGLRIDFVVRDRLGREWKTAHLGVWTPELDPLESRDPIHLAESSAFGGVERFLALLIEEGGEFSKEILG
ncbi:MAG: hypothetical protein KDK48_02225, partial [Chlamydiia bacterium]|nr:hypothetical protein [Chlamydiia bacterium]